MPTRPIGVFDSGVGGLTVYRALKEALPNENFIYLGDMARLPYGTKSAETIAYYSEQVTRRLMKEGIKLLVVACNTATALGLNRIQETFPDLISIGVVEAGARAAVQASQKKRIVVLATGSTVASGAYECAIKKMDLQVHVQSIATNLLVGLAEEGWAETKEAEGVIRRYLDQIEQDSYDTLVLGCTHFPILMPAFRRVVPASVHIVDSAQMAAKEVKESLFAVHLEKESIPESNRDSVSDSILESIPDSVRFMVTDGVERFRAVGRSFLPDNDFDHVDLVDL